MNAGSIRRLKNKIVVMTMFSFIVIMLFTGIAINLSSLYQTKETAMNTLGYIIDNEGNLPSPQASSAESEVEEIIGEEYSPEFQFSTRYFAVLFDENDNLLSAKMNHIASVTRDEAIEYAELLLKLPVDSGRLRSYYYRRGTLEDGRRIVAVLDMSTRISANNRVIHMTVLICAVGLLLSMLVVFFLSKQLIKPEIENARRQKQFITNASHELKTPLAVIRANTEIEEMMNGESEWTQSTMRQVDRLSGLIQNLVMISKAAEKEDRSEMTEINASQAVQETVKPYESLAQQDKKKLTINIQQDVMMLADESRIRQLASLLIDNAFKYCDENGKVNVHLNTLKKGKTLHFVVSNSFADGAKVDYSRFFDRFYRADKSHNVDKGGYGIGLSIAESICTSYGGTITARWKDGMISFICMLPIH